MLIIIPKAYLNQRLFKEKFGPMPVSEADLGSSRRNATWELEVLADRYQRAIEIYLCSPGDHGEYLKIIVSQSIRSDNHYTKTGHTTRGNNPIEHPQRQSIQFSATPSKECISWQKSSGAFFALRTTDRLDFR